jgi:hypothetical protein
LGVFLPFPEGGLFAGLPEEEDFPVLLLLGLREDDEGALFWSIPDR